MSWFRGFHVVFNALDNLEARRHVNKLCLAADVALVESGTTGFNGQVAVIKKGVTACYDCTPKESPKSFPVCTIRSTPSQPIHCIVWARSYLLKLVVPPKPCVWRPIPCADMPRLAKYLVSARMSLCSITQKMQIMVSRPHLPSPKDDSFRFPLTIIAAREIEELKKECEELKKIKDSMGSPKFPQMLFDKVFDTDIERIRSLEDMWKSRRPPEPLEYEKLSSRAARDFSAKDAILADGQRTWSLEENLVVFIDSLDRLSKRLLHLKKTKDPSSADPIITFDKDDEDTLDFVTSSANIRSSIFGIDRKSKFDIKQMAGNIIPAIATTNAVVAGLCVLESFKILKGDYAQAKEVGLDGILLVWCESNEGSARFS